MPIKLTKEAYCDLIREDLDFLDKHCENCPELAHIKSIIKNSIDWYYPEYRDAANRIENRLKEELEMQKANGKTFLSDKEVDDLIDGILKENK